MQETWFWSLGWEDPLEKGMAIHSSILAWRIAWTEEPGGYSPWGRKKSDTTERLTDRLAHVYRDDWLEPTAQHRELYPEFCGHLTGKEIQKEETHVHVWLIHFAVQQKLTHYTPVKKMGEKERYLCAPRADRLNQ